ncbi:hypothetical protein J2848_002733 [Azospirillum lipoferum]|uniref:Uncharacterized protein n=1 Tax=Azospirillum lipoferum TaxID=193 RepID=A0A5A9GNY3_AZOLI|nr:MULTISPECIES: hypothetical protein [Azospirillum]KAA0596113.1 hypothetical protein FZ942_13135 [Azospirillum lipoferum]MCP1611060.1 hypothetical protein [Azospirillum lipoferum]MDW5533812.1 hypothetical protein [Azospirillum sp. NL1]
MTTARQAPATEHRLTGLEADNLLAFLALLGLLRALEATDRAREAADRLHPRACWSLDEPPLRPVLRLTHPLSQDEVSTEAARGIGILAEAHDFGGREKLDYNSNDARSLLKSATTRDRADLLAALMTDAAIKDSDKPHTSPIDPTPFCLMSGQGRQLFLERISRVPKESTPKLQGRSRKAAPLTEITCLSDTLFRAWHRTDPTTASFRWDPEEDVRYALMAGNPTDDAYKLGTQHGANRLAAIGLAALTLAPETRAGRVRPTLPGGAWKDGFSFAWPVWRDPASLSAIRVLLGHPDLREPGGLSHLGVEHVFAAQRISVGKFMNFTRARLIGTPDDPS